MSSTDMLTGNSLTRKIWATEDWVNMGMKTAFGHLVERGGIFAVNDFKGQKARGDTITYDYTNKLTGIPIGEGGTLDGHEEALNLGYYQMAMNVTRIGVLNPNDDTIEQQRTLVDFPSPTRKLIPARHGELMDTAVFYHLAGAAPTSFTLNGTTWSGNNRLFPWLHNTPTAPTSARIVRAGGAATDQALTSSNKFTLQLIDYALEKNATSDQPIQPFEDGTFDVFLSPEQVTDLMNDTTSPIQWSVVQQAYIAGGKADVFEGETFKGMRALGQYNGVNIYRAPRVAYGVNGSTSAVITTVRRAVMVGKDALSFATPFGGNAAKNVPLKYFSQLKDYEYYKGLEGRLIAGLKKTVASNSEDIGVMVLSSYAAANA